MRSLSFFVAVSLFIAGSLPLQAFEMKDGDQVVILSGQNFEIWGWSPSGYVRLVVDELVKSGMKESALIPVDRSKIAEMFQYVESDIIPRKPSYVLIIPGTVDYNPWSQKEAPESFKATLMDMVEKLQAAGIQPILATSYASNSNLSEAPNKNVAKHNDAIRAVAVAKNVRLIDLVKVLDESPKLLPLDGSPAAKSLVNILFAAEILRAIGYSDQEVAACYTAWLDKPGGIGFAPSVSVNTYDKLNAAAKASGKDVDVYMNQVLHEAVK